MSKVEQSPIRTDSETGYLHIGKSVIRPFQDFVIAPEEPLRNGEFIPGGSFRPGKYPALDEALQTLKKTKPFPKK
jgi:hypothetical protein